MDGDPEAAGIIQGAIESLPRQEPFAEEKIVTPGWEWRGSMFIQRISRFSIIAAFCSAIHPRGPRPIHLP
jgi:hypothetical protein